MNRRTCLVAVAGFALSVTHLGTPLLFGDIRTAGDSQVLELPKTTSGRPAPCLLPQR